MRLKRYFVIAAIYAVIAIWGLIAALQDPSNWWIVVIAVGFIAVQPSVRRQELARLDFADSQAARIRDLEGIVEAQRVDIVNLLDELAIQGRQ